jgi:hypothetical protein
VLRIERLAGRPVLIVFESRESAEQNAAFKERLGRFARSGNYRQSIHLVPVASVETYDFFPARGFVEDAIAEESRRFGVTIWCDWTGAFRRAYRLRPAHSSVILVSGDRRVLFAFEGALPRHAQDRVIELLRREVDAQRTAGEEGEAPLGPQTQSRGSAPREELEVARLARADRGVDAIELVRDRALLGDASRLDVGDGGQRWTDRDPEVRPLGLTELVAERDRHDACRSRDPRDGGGAGTERERARGDGPLAPLREDPEESTRRA